jgi:hypothetical protein
VSDCGFDPTYHDPMVLARELASGPMLQSAIWISFSPNADVEAVRDVLGRCISEGVDIGPRAEEAYLACNAHLERVAGR